MAFSQLTRVVWRPCLSLVLVLLAGGTHAFAGSTRLSMQSEPGDYIGIGRETVFVASDGTFTAWRNYKNGVTIGFATPNYSAWWYLDFGAPDDDLLTPGVYANAVRHPFQPAGVPGLSVSGDGRGCNTLTGSFQVLEVTYGAGDVIEAFRATFEQYCEGAAGALRGRSASMPWCRSISSRPRG